MKNERKFTSEESPEVSGEIDEQKEMRPEASAEEKREARVMKYRELLAKQEAMLKELSPQQIEEKARQARENALEKGNDAEMADRLQEAMRKNLEEKSADVMKLVDEIRTNISKLESGQDDLYSSEQ